jgi:hypothetical protein
MHDASATAPTTSRPGSRCQPGRPAPTRRRRGAHARRGSPRSRGEDGPHGRRLRGPEDVLRHLPRPARDRGRVGVGPVPDRGGRLLPDYVHEHYDKDLQPDTTRQRGSPSRGCPPSVVGDRVPEGYKGVCSASTGTSPRPQHPRGRRVVWAKNEVLFEDDNPYPWLPYVMFGGTPVPGRFWPNCVTSDLISPQTELNKVKSPDRRQRRADRQPPAC